MKRPDNSSVYLTAVILSGLALFGSAVAGQLPDSLRSFGKPERQQLGRALALQGMTEAELGFDKKWAVDSFFRFKIVDDILDNPLHGPNYCDSSALLVQAWRDNIPAQLVFEAQQTDVKVSFGDTVSLNRELDAEAKRLSLELDGLSDNLKAGLCLILGSFAVAERHMTRALAAVKNDEADRLLVNAPTLWGDEDDTTEHYLKGAINREFDLKDDTSLSFNTDTVLPILRKIDRGELALSGLAVALAANRTRVELVAQAPAVPLEAQTKKAAGVTGDVFYYAETRWGRVAVGGKGPNTYDGDFALVIDLGGNDRYTGRVGAGIGLPETRGTGKPADRPFGVCLDLGGNDVYDAENKLFNQGAGLFGAGILIDCAGNDVYRGWHNAQGIAMYGTGVLADLRGNDLYDAGWYGQGCGMVGFGLMLDLAGDDSYRIPDYGQAFAAVSGYGLLADFAGDDVYYAGGKYIHHPLLPEDNRSFAQGFAIGFRPDCSGGIGFLFDQSGNDFYDAEVFAQACSYWYSLGMIYDGAGQDHYTASQYSQGAGIHLSVGILIDRSGDDQYFSRLGPTQGEGHDLSVGILIDRKGNDSYDCSGGQGIGLTNSAAIFIDAAGHDNYMTTEAIGQGTGTWARGFGSIGVFIDEDGDNDRYVKGSPGEDNAIWTQGTYGTGISLKAKPKPEIPVEETTYTPDTSSVKRPIKDVFKDASVWQVGEARNRTRRARKELITRGAEAALYIAQEQLNTKDGLALEAMTEFAKTIPETLAPYLFKGLHDSNRYTRSNCAYLIGQARVRNGVDSLLAALKLPGFRPRWAILAFGEIKDQKVVPVITRYVQDKSEVTRITTCATLGSLKDERGVPALITGLGDELFTVRSAAEQGLVDVGSPSVGYLLKARPTGQAPVHYARALGTLTTKLDTVEDRAQRIEARRILLGFLADPDPAVRGVAVEALGKMIDPAVRAKLEAALEDESDLFVLGKYEAVLAGLP